MDLQGYAQITAEPKGFFPMGVDVFKGAIVRVLEFTYNGDVLCVSPNGQAIADIQSASVLRSFRCCEHGEVLCPPNMGLPNQMMYSMACMSRKGGYPPIARQMVIVASLSTGKFTDSFLWQKQD